MGFMLMLKGGGGGVSDNSYGERACPFNLGLGYFSADSLKVPDEDSYRVFSSDNVKCCTGPGISCRTASRWF